MRPVLIDTNAYTSFKRGDEAIIEVMQSASDMWIAAQALEHGCVLCTYDTHFKAIYGLVTGNNLLELSV